MDDLKIYCECEEDQFTMVDFCIAEDADCKVSTWEPDPDTGTWGMFVDEFQPELWDKLVQFLDGEESEVLEFPVEMALGDGTVSYIANNG